MDYREIVGVVSGLISIFVFLTGVTSARELRKPSITGEGSVSPQRRSGLRLILWLSVPVFIMSLVITLSSGLQGSDTGGTQFLLLIGGAILLRLYATVLRQSLSVALFLVTCVVVLGGLGLLFGTISAGEESEGAIAGLIIGVGTGLFGLFFRTERHGIQSRNNRPRLWRASRPDDTRALQEKEVLKLARQQSGEICVADVALHTLLSLDDARIVLDQLADRRFCEKRQLSGGAVMYRFPDFRPR
ncbi:MAG: hypothetical protein ACT4NY_13025 [Pseudonocardiales bacterium]